MADFHCIWQDPAVREVPIAKLRGDSEWAKGYSPDRHWGELLCARAKPEVHAAVQPAAASKWIDSEGEQRIHDAGSGVLFLN
jgi:hypothetical protein